MKTFKTIGAARAAAIILFSNTARTDPGAIWAHRWGDEVLEPQAVDPARDVRAGNFTA